MGPASESRRALAQALVVATATALVRLWLAPRYAGWEESDTGNLMLVREVLDSGFTWFRPEYMPGYYALSAGLRALVDAPRGAPLAVSMAASLALTVLVVLATRRFVGAGASWLAALFAVLQPELALYGSSTLRFPVFAAFGFAAALATALGARSQAAGAGALAFSVRMDALVTVWPPTLLGLRRRRVALGLFAGSVVAWQLYVSVVHGEGLFFLGPAALNQGEGSGWREAWVLLTWTLPRKISWSWWLLAAVGAVAVWRGGARPGGRVFLLFGGASLGFWLFEGYVARHGANHNLYWVWLMPALPYIALLGAAGWQWIDRHLLAAPRALRGAVWLAVAASMLPSFAQEVRYQLDRSERWYRPQLELARWLEDQPGISVVALGIPRVFLHRRSPPAVRVVSWMELPQELRGDEPGFGRWLQSEHMDYVVWMAEEWTEAPAIAPSLAAGKRVRLGPVELDPLRREDGYGWILYRVLD